MTEGKGYVKKLLLPIGTCFFLGIFSFLCLNKDQINFSPWNTNVPLSFPSYADSNAERIAIVDNSQQSIIIINREKELLLKIDAREGSFYRAEFVAIDEENNVYVLDKVFGGAFENNVERIVKYSSEGKYIDCIFRNEYINNDFIFSKGKVCGMSYFNGFLFVSELDDDGFSLLKISVETSEADLVHYFNYPNAFRDLLFANVTPKSNLITVSTKSNTILQYDFSGDVLNEYTVPDTYCVRTALSDINGNIIYDDVKQKQILRITPGYSGETFFAQNDSGILMISGSKQEVIDSYIYPQNTRRQQIILFLLFCIDALIFTALLIAFIKFILKKKTGEKTRLLFSLGMCIVFGAVLAAALIIRETNKKYYSGVYTELENISRLSANNIDSNIITSITQRSQNSDEAYAELSAKIKQTFSQFKFEGKKVYQYVWTVKGKTLYSMYDSQSALGALYPFATLTEDDSYILKVQDERKYIYKNTVNKNGNWLLACGPIFDANGNVAAIIETGCDITLHQSENKRMIFMVMITVLLSAIAILLIILELIIFVHTFKENKNDHLCKKPLAFRASLLRPLMFLQIFSLFLVMNFLPFYSENLTPPNFEALSKLPILAKIHFSKFLVNILPILTMIVFLLLSLLAFTPMRKRCGVKPLMLMSGIFLVTGNVICFIAPSIILLCTGFAFIGFGCAFLPLVCEAMFKWQKEIFSPKERFAALGSSVLSGSSAGVFAGIVLVQFCPPPLIFLLFQVRFP
ncbi:MAG: hypothetical protein Ta2G_16770 [Termitinemataceae bacterium]|nr:MAG: hypothetical protein Ta2G_16770 [Termitinemataceae bacterium]